MKLIKNATASLSLAFLAGLFFSGNAAAAVPPHHPDLNDLLSEFGGHFRCPHAQEWLTKGPHQAARDLGLPVLMNQETRHRALQQQQQGGGPPPGVLGGGPPPGAVGGPPPGGDGEDAYCMIAPGPAGGGHQATFSSGYKAACPGTPAEGSPYMWPLAWSAGLEDKSMSFGSDKVKYHSVGKVYYRLDRNWKRQDWFYQRGIQRSFGRFPCAPENKIGDLDCRRDTDQRTTAIHRGAELTFITWKNNTEGDAPENVEKCLRLTHVVGNLRPDWFMDTRGASTDVQYLGDQHVVHNNEPRLVKQWRKHDFVNQYFTMSVLANADPDEGIHWPMILNVPGEGSTEDTLQVYTNHTVLTDNDNDLFLVDQALEDSGVECSQIQSSGGRPADVEPVPSNLEVDPNAWFSNEFTFSPIWEPPQKGAVTDNDNDYSSGAGPARGAITSVDTVTAESCYDSKTNNVELTVIFNDAVPDEDDKDADIPQQLPWMALGYRDTEECLMTPPSGGNSDIILISSTSDLNEGDVEVPVVGFGSMSPAVKRLEPNAISSISEELVPLAKVSGFSNVHLSVPASTVTTPPTVDKKSVSLTQDGTVQLTFRQSMPSQPEVMNLMYAIGTGPELGYHISRDCFQVKQFPECSSPVVMEDMDEMGEESPNATANDVNGVMSSSAQQLFMSSFVFLLNLGMLMAKAGCLPF